MISGNPMRLDHGNVRIELDEQWRTRLTSRQLVTFQRVAGSLNKRLGYDP
jgi:hypothetical protein